MNVRHYGFVAGLLSLSLALFAKDGGNAPYITTMGEQSALYARCLPTEKSGNKGTTQILRVTAQGDEELIKFDWYNRRGLVLGWSPTAGKVAVMRLEQEAGLAPDKQIEFSFYLGKDLLKSYTTADLQKLGAVLQWDAVAAESGVQGPDGNPPQRAQYHVEGCFQVWNTNDYYYKVSFPQTDVHSAILIGEKPPVKTVLFDIVTGKPCQVSRPKGENHEEMKLLE